MSESLKDRMERLHKALLLKRLLTDSGVEVGEIQELLDEAKAREQRRSAPIISK